MWSIIKNLPTSVKWIGGTLIVLVVIAVYQFGYIRGEKSTS